LSITQGANERSTLSGVIMPESDQTISLGDRIGVFLDDVEPGARTFNGTSSVLERAFSSGAVDNFFVSGWFYVSAITTAHYGVYIGDFAGGGAGRNGYGIFINFSDQTWRGVYHTPSGPVVFPSS